MDSQPRRILVPVNRTIGEAQLARAAALDADIVLLRVLPRAGAAVEASARAYLDTLVAYFAAQGRAAEARVAVGRVAAVVLETVRLEPFSAIVLGVTHRPRALRSVIGSTSEAIVRRAPCPVILVERADLGPKRALLSFAEAAELAGPLSRRLPRVETVETSRIVGSVGRANELASDFRPHRWARRKGDEQRLKRIRTALERGEILPPVELYKLGYGFYVLDGHHRVAAAHLLKQPELDAYVVDHVPSAPYRAA
jgi:nucleotide-binding universal stress UspA family protein